MKYFDKYIVWLSALIIKPISMPKRCRFSGNVGQGCTRGLKTDFF